MAVSYVSHALSATWDNGSASPHTFSFTPSGTPKGILIFTVAAATSIDRFPTAPSYGGVAMSFVSGGYAVDTAGEPGQVKASFLGSGIPSGMQTVSIPHDLTTAATKVALVIELSASGDTAIVGTPVLLQNDGTLSEQNVNTGSDTALRFAAAWSGLTAQPSVGANSTNLAFTDPYTNQHSQSASFTACRETTAGSGSRPVGFSSGTSDDRAVVHLAVKEVAAAGGTARSFAIIVG